MITQAQHTRWSNLCGQTIEGKLTVNQAYKYAQVDGDDAPNSGFKGSFKDWIEVAKAHGWIGAPPPQEIIETAPDTKPKNYVVPVLLGIGVAIILIAVVSGSKDDKK